MNTRITLTVTSLLSILFFSLHFADDIVRGFEPGGTRNFAGVLIAVVWLYATLALASGRVGLIIILLMSIGGAAIPFLHMMGAGLVGGRIANSSGVFFWVWTLIALGATAGCSVILSARALWSLRRGRGDGHWPQGSDSPVSPARC